MSAADDDFFRTLLGEQCARVPTLPKRQREELMAGGFIRTGMLFVVVLERGPDGSLLLDQADTYEMELGDRTQASAIEFADEVAQLARRLPNRSLVLRAPAFRGQCLAVPITYKAEAILQLVPNLDVHIVAHRSVANWVNRTDPVLPPAQVARLGPVLAREQAKAIEAAAFAFEHGDQPRFSLPEGE